MRPVRLEMEAFGPFAKEQTINFEEFKDGEVFLICGVTGAGKTTIFDAICFALYGSVSGLRKEVRTLRSDFASLTTVCSVKFSFEVNGEKFFIERKPDQSVQKLKGSGVKQIKHSVELKLPNGKIETNVKEVNKLIVEEIIGLDRENFNKLAMLPQGQFFKLLTEKGEEQAKTFRKLFGTQIFELISNKIFERKQEILKEYGAVKELNLKVVKNVIVVNCCLNEVRTNRLECGGEIKQQLKIQNLQDLKLQNLIRKRVVELDLILQELEAKLQLTKRCEKSRKLAAEIELQLEKLILIKPKEEDLEQKRELINKIEKLELLNLNFQNADLNFRNKRDEKKKLIVEILKIKKLFNSLSLKNNLMEEFEGKLVRTEKKINALISIKQTLNLIKNVELEETKVEAEIRTNSAKIEALKNQFEEKKIELEIENLNEQIQCLKKILNLELETETVSAEFLKLNENLKIETENFLKNAASKIAENLKTGDCCPVCGAVVCSEIKKKDEIKLSSQIELSNLQKEVFNKKEKIFELKSLINELKFKYNSQNLKKTEITDKKSVEIVLNEEIKLLEKLKKEKTKLTVKIKCSVNLNLEQIEKLSLKLNKKMHGDETLILSLCDQKKSLQQTVPKQFLNLNRTLQIEKLTKRSCSEIKQQIEKFKQFRNEVEKKLSCLISEFKLVSGNVKEALKVLKLAERNLKKLLQSTGLTLETFREESCSLMETKKNVEDGVQILNKIKDLKIQLKTLRMNIAEFKNHNSKEISNLKEVREKEKVELVKVESAILNRLIVNEKNLKELESFEKKIAELEKKYETAKIMSDVSKGSRTRIGLEKFVLARYLNDVFRHANVWLKKITDGRFCFCNLENLELKNLNFFVIDSFSGRIRQVSTLSGGEIFAASLALCLGLSDVVSERKGGIELRTMLIDEGFGSLDSQYLANVMNCLHSLNLNGKIIGIISHVAELQSMVEKQIVVTRRNFTGSKIELKN